MLYALLHTRLFFLREDDFMLYGIGNAELPRRLYNASD
jgi:hypothetical protein